MNSVSTGLYSFIDNVKLDEGDIFHDAIDVILDRKGAAGLREFLDNLIAMMKEFYGEDTNKAITVNLIHNDTNEFILSKLTNLL